MQTLIGKVVGNKSKDTVSVLVEFTKPHRLYRKLVKRGTKFLVHNPGVQVQIGETVVIESCRPISKNKHFVLQNAKSQKLDSSETKKENTEVKEKIEQKTVKKQVKKTVAKLKK